MMKRREFGVAAVAAVLGAASNSGAEEKRLSVGVIGHTGRGNYGHGIDTMWLSVPETEIVAVADADAKGLEAELKKLKVGKGFADYRAMLREMKPDIAAIGPRHIDQHRDMCLAAIEAGVRGIYMEKPFCRSPKEADEIVAACEKTGVKLAVAHRNRWNPVLPVMAQAIKDGAIGRVLELRARGKEDQRGGALDLWVLGGHLFNLAVFFAGRPVACSALVLKDGRPATREDVKEGDEGVGPLGGNEVHARFETESGWPVFFDSIHDAGTKVAGFGLQIIGTEGMFDLRIDADPLAHHVPGSPFHPVKQPRPWVPVSTAGIGRPEPVEGAGKQVMGHLTGARDLLAALKEDRQPLCSAEDGRLVVEMVCAVFESHRAGGGRVTWPLVRRENPLAGW